MTEVLKPDLCVIGAGSGGLTVAAAARAFGASVVLIEKADMGGDCLNTGCVPSKALLAAAKHAHAWRNGMEFGIGEGEPDVDFSKVHVHVHDIIASIAPHDSVARFEGLGVTVLKAHASFKSADCVVAGGTEIRARRFVIAAGSRAAVPSIDSLKSVSYLTNESLFDLKELPGHLIIVGGGPIGMEMAQAHRRLGSKVTVIEAFAPLGKDDPELTVFALDRLRHEGVEILGDTKVISVAPGKGSVTVETVGPDGPRRVSGTHLLLAVGRTPNVDGLELEAAGIAYDRSGIRVDAGLRTSNRRVYAIGDITGGLQFTHVASQHASLVVRNALFGLPAKFNRDQVPWVTYTDPEIANVGLDEKSARARHGSDVKIIRWSFAENDRARAERRTDGLLKLITRRNGEILGCGIAGAQAGELISLFAYAMATKQKAGSLTGFIAPYPTLTEVAKRAGVEFYRDKLDNPVLGWWTKFIRLLP